MKLTATFYSDKVHSFDTLMYINGRTKEIVYNTDLNDGFATYRFFKDIAKFVKSPKVRKTILDYDSEDYYQFAVMCDDKITRIVWFDLIVNDHIKISHDNSFYTTFIKKNNQIVPFGRLSSWYRYNKKNVRLPLYRESNVSARAYKYIANQIKNSWS